MLPFLPRLKERLYRTIGLLREVNPKKRRRDIALLVQAIIGLEKSPFLDNTFLQVFMKISVEYALKALLQGYDYRTEPELFE